MALMKTPVDLSKDIDEWSSIVLIFSLREEIKVAHGSIGCQWESRVSWEQGRPPPPCPASGLALFLARVDFFSSFLVLLETRNKVPTPRLDCALQFQAGI